MDDSFTVQRCFCGNSIESHNRDPVSFILAALTMIEEIDTLPHEVQSVAYAQAREWLANNDSPDIKPRLKAVAKKIDGAGSMTKTPNAHEVLFNKRLDLEAEVLKFERGLISETLAKINGKVTRSV
jgi:hypothetical protein